MFNLFYNTIFKRVYVYDVIFFRSKLSVIYSMATKPLKNIKHNMFSIIISFYCVCEKKIKKLYSF